jgi:hypothetical protein
MQMTLTRNHFDDKSTQGALFIGTDWMCYTLELPYKDGLSGSCIPNGNYQVTLSPSPHFQQVGETDPWVASYANQIPHILNVPNRSGIEIHWGNKPEDTDGCPLVGMSNGVDFVGSSRDAFTALMTQLLSATDPIWITVEGQPEVESAGDEESFAD